MQANQPPARNTVILPDDAGLYRLGTHLDILEDPSGPLTPEEVLSPTMAERLSPSRVEVAGYGFSKSVHWARVNLDRRTTREQGWMLQFGSAQVTMNAA